MLWPVRASALTQHAGRFQFKAVVLGQVPVELQHFLRLDHLEALGHHRQRSFGVGAVQHLVLGEGFDGADAVIAADEADFGLLDLPVHAGLFLPDFDGLVWS